MRAAEKRFVYMPVYEGTPLYYIFQAKEEVEKFITEVCEDSSPPILDRNKFKVIEIEMAGDLFKKVKELSK